MSRFRPKCRIAGRGIKCRLLTLYTEIQQKKKKKIFFSNSGQNSGQIFAQNLITKCQQLLNRLNFAVILRWHAGRIKYFFFKILRGNLRVAFSVAIILPTIRYFYKISAENDKIYSCIWPPAKFRQSGLPLKFCYQILGKNMARICPEFEKKKNIFFICKFSVQNFVLNSGLNSGQIFSSGFLENTSTKKILGSAATFTKQLHPFYWIYCK